MSPSPVPRLVRTLALWALLLFLFAAFYWLFAPHSHGGGEGPEAAQAASEARPEGLLPYLHWLPVVALFVFFTTYVRRVQHWGRLNMEGMAFLEERDFARAARAFKGVARAWIPSARRMGRTNLGICMLRAGELERALELFATVQQKGALRGKLRCLWPSLLATCHALLGDVPAGRQWLEECWRLQGEERDELLLLPEILLLCREGDFRAVEETLRRRWREAEAAGAATMKQLRLLWAFALERLGPAASEAARSEALAAVEPFRPGDFDALAVRWPELRAFLEARGLAAPRAAA